MPFYSTLKMLDRRALIIITAAFIQAISCASIGWRDYPNNRPIIGVLAQEVDDTLPTNTTVDTYIAASYVKFIEASGARAVPIHLNRSQTSYTDVILNSINGVLIPGGGVNLDTSMYAQLGKYILDYAVQRNQAGDYFPVWGTCLGFELMATWLEPTYDVLTPCDASNIALPLQFSADATESRLFGDLPSDVYQSLLNRNVTANFHHYCLTPDTVTSTGMSQNIHVLSTNLDVNGLEFVSTFESITYPFYATQWHPEKAVWEWNTDEMSIPHEPEAVQVTQFFSSFLGNEARKSTHAFADKTKETNELIYNINPTYTGKTGSDFEQEYIFKSG